MSATTESHVLEIITGVAILVISGAVGWLFKSVDRLKTKTTEHDISIQSLQTHQACQAVLTVTQQVAVLQEKAKHWDDAVDKLNRIHDTVLRIATKMECD